MFARENEFDADVIANAGKFGVPSWVIKATIGKESSFDPKAYRPEPAHADASRGLMQILGATAKGLGLRGDVGDDLNRVGGLYEPALNIQIGTKYLAQLRQRYPAEPWDVIYAAYNAGSVRRNPTTKALENEAHVVGWRRIADYFNPGWSGRPPTGFKPAPAAGRKPAP